jgi:integrase
MRKNLTKQYIERISSPDAGRLNIRDDRAPGLVLTITANGVKSFYLYRRIGGRPTRLFLGRFPEMSVENARKAATKTQGEIADGKNPAEQRRTLRGIATFGALFDAYLDKHAKVHKRSWKGDEWQRKRYLTAWDGRKLNELTRTDVRAMHGKVGKKHGHYAANRVLALVRTVYSWGIKEGIAKENPATGISMFAETKRDRFLTADELPKFFAAIDNEPVEWFRHFVQLLLLTGARRSNVQAMAWSDIDLDRGLWRIGAASSKNKDAMVVVLPEEAIDVLDDRRKVTNGSPWVFPSHGKTGHVTEPKGLWKAMLERAGISDLRLHDLRRTLGSWQAIGGSSLNIIGASLGHKSVQTTAVYARLSVDPVRQSVQAAATEMLRLGRPEVKEGDSNGAKY